MNDQSFSLIFEVGEKILWWKSINEKHTLESKLAASGARFHPQCYIFAVGEYRTSHGLVAIQQQALCSYQKRKRKKTKDARGTVEL